MCLRLLLLHSRHSDTLLNSAAGSRRSDTCRHDDTLLNRSLLPYNRSLLNSDAGSRRSDTCRHDDTLLNSDAGATQVSFALQ
jgi:hypothetical protein